MKIICILILATIATSRNVDILNNVVNDFRETDGVLKCISNIDTKLTINNVTTFCGEGEYASQAECYSAYSSFKLCLINNNCQQDIDALSVHGWLFRLSWLVGTAGPIC